MDLTALQQLAISAGLGLLLGLERERQGSSLAGIRTFPFIAIFGTVCAQLAQVFGGWMLAAGLVALAAIIILANFIKMQAGDRDPGTTTELAMLIVYGLGALLVVGNTPVTLVLGGAIVVLLHLKEPLHKFARAVGERDMRAIMQFVLISLVILPVLPNQYFGPYGVWNPFKLWLMVVLIVGISLCGYVAYKLLGARAGSLLGGVIGGVVSSTATTVSFARRAAGEEKLAALAACVIMMASCIAVTRTIVEVAAMAPAQFRDIAMPLGVLLLVCLLIAGALFLFSSPASHSRMPAPKNPAELKSALFFAGLYAVVLLAVAAGKEHFGARGLYLIAAISGLTDTDAITLSTAQLAASKEIDVRTAWHSIVIATMANFVFKFGVVAVLAPRALARRVGVAFLGALAGAGLLLWLWPW